MDKPCAVTPVAEGSASRPGQPLQVDEPCVGHTCAVNREIGELGESP